MARVLIDSDTLDIRVGLLERVILAERPRRLPLSRIRRVDAHPPLDDMMLHWSDQSGVWLCGVSAYDGHMIPSARNPSSTIAIEVEGEAPERIYVEIDDESPAQAAERIGRALYRSRAEEPRASTRGTNTRNTEGSMPTTYETTSTHQTDTALGAELASEFDDVRLRDPLLQGSVRPPPEFLSVPAPEMKLDDDRDLRRIGGWLVALGTLGLLTGAIMLASGALPGLLAVGAGVGSALLGGVALAVVAHHQG
ncbi:MAG: hypothetical protein ABW252_19310 [Polyangiales bacterium]